MKEQQAKAATAVYGQLVAAREELERLRALRPLLRGVSVDTGPGGATVGGTNAVRLDSLTEVQLRQVADLMIWVLRQRIVQLEAQISQL